jgi:hypothetical protein
MITTEPAKVPAWRPLFAAGTLLVGIGLLAFSFVWSTISRGQGNWSEEQALRYQAASARLHSLSHKYARPPEEGSAATAREELKNAQIEFQRLRSDLDAAIARPGRIALWLRVVGAVLAAVGGYGLIRNRPVEKN